MSSYFPKRIKAIHASVKPNATQKSSVCEWVIRCVASIHPILHSNEKNEVFI